jgi:hypothetical protein
MDAFSVDRFSRQEIARGMPDEPALHFRTSFSLCVNFNTDGGLRLPELAV